MSTFHYLPEAHDLDIRFQAVGFNDPTIESMANALLQSMREYTKENKAMMIYHNGDKIFKKLDDDRVVKTDEFETRSVSHAVSELAGCLRNQETHDIVEGNIAHYEARMYFQYWRRHYEMSYCIAGTDPNGESIYGPVEITLQDGYLRAVMGKEKDHKIRKRIFICIGSTGYDSVISKVCKTLHDETKIRMVTISEYEILKEAGINLGAVRCGDECRQKDVEAFSAAMKNGEGFDMLIRMYVGLFLADTETSVMFIHCISVDSMVPIVSAASSCMDVYCSSGCQDEDPNNIVMINQDSRITNSIRDSRVFANLHHLYGCKTLYIADLDPNAYINYEYLHKEIANNIYQVPKNKDKDEDSDSEKSETAEDAQQGIDSDTYDIVHGITEEIMKAYDLYSDRGDFYAKLQVILHNRVKTTVSIQ